ncbi:hypothetical protein ILP92_00955 [Maribius pontilimi]|uniref:Uncharacterized protein n=1 Tax=Palleronia pontilimi TaxID=1964209 RepID=A0A934ID50_9RHOB|nr:hypothetical protein [Palleronia pontilimi]MBJ3761320.1 hypothetical protein [Palleronia pontilimi]
MRLMLKTLWQLARICLIAASVTLTGWTALAAPEPWERRALDLPQGRLGWEDRQSLRESRLLRLAMRAAPELVVDLMAYTAPEVPRDLLAQALHDAAEGRSLQPIAPMEDPETPTPPVRRAGGAKFVRVE